MPIRSFLFFIICCLTTHAYAERQRFIFDKGHTRIFFDVNHIGFSQYRGMFHDYKGEFRLDLDRPENSTVDVTIDTRSADMYYEKMNEHLLNEDLLHVKKFPEARFISTGITRHSDKDYKMMGDFTLMGVTKPIVFDVVLNKVAPHPISRKLTAGFTATTTIDRTAFGLDYAVPMVSKEVNIYLSVEAYKAARHGSKRK